MNAFCFKIQEHRFHEGKELPCSSLYSQWLLKNKMPQVFLTTFISEDLGITILRTITGLLQHIKLLLQSFIFLLVEYA